MSFVVRGEGPFADAVRRALEYVQQHGIDLSGVEVEVVPDQSIRDAGAYTDHLGGLRFRIRYHPQYASDPVLASHEAGHVAYWTWQSKKKGGVQYIPDIDELLAEALGAVTARQLYGRPVTFKGAPMNLTQVLPKQTTYITTIVDGKPVAVKLPEWFNNMDRYRAGILVSPYFYNVTNWAHVFGNFTAMPEDVIETVHKAWKSGAVEVVPGWGAVWRTTPTWTPLGTDQTTNNKNQTSIQTTVNTQQTTSTTTTGDKTQNNTTKTVSIDTQKTSISTTTTSNTTPSGLIVPTQPTADVPLPPSNVQPPRFFSSDITPSSAAPEWGSYISGRRVLVAFRNWPFLDTQTLKDTRKDYVAGVGVVADGKLRFEDKVPIPRVIDPNAWIELVDEKTGKVLARLRSDELYKLTNEGAPVTLYWSHVAVEEKWPGWERFVDRAKELDEKLGTWRPSGTVAPPPGVQQTSARGVGVVNPDGTISAVRVANAPTEYVPPKVPDDVRRQFENLLSDLKKLGEGVNLKNVGEVHDKFIQLRDKALDVARAYPQLIDEVNKAAEKVGSAVREASDKLYDALAKAAGRDSFWRGEGDVKTPIGVYKYDPATGAFLLSLYDSPTAENVVGFIKEDGTPIVVKKTQNMSEALEEYNKLTSGVVKTGGGFIPPVPPASQASPSGGGQHTDFLQPIRGAVDFLANALKAGAGVVLTAVGGAKPSSEFIQPTSEQQKTAVKTGGGFIPPPIPAVEQKTNEFVAVRPSRPPDYVLAEEAARRVAGTFNTALDAVTPSLSNSQPSYSGYRPADYLVSQQSAPSTATPPIIQLAPQTSSEPRRYRGRPVATAI